MPHDNTEELNSPRPVAPETAEDMPEAPLRLNLVTPSFWDDPPPGLLENSHPGEVYYTQKGEYIAHGKHAIIEQLASGHIIKSPLPHHFKPSLQKRNRRMMEHEAEIYQHMGHCPTMPQLVRWDPIHATLTLQHMPNKDLGRYLKAQPWTPLPVRTQWASQAAKALDALHMAGITHNDVAPRNFLLDDALNLRICDFGSSSFPEGSPPIQAPGPRYQPRRWPTGYRPTPADDVFALGSVLHFIMTGEEPLSEVEEGEVELRFAEGRFPNTLFLHGDVVQRCWRERTTTAAQVVARINE
ncbi:hypothetical protein ACHAQA_007652 [Verticillium albo-atrum]